MIEHIGNKVPFEKVLNIVASNGYFEKKRSEYAASKIKVAKELADLTLSDWKIEQIIERDAEVSKTLVALLGKCESAYDLKDDADVAAPTEEQKKQIEMFKQKGWI